MTFYEVVIWTPTYPETMVHIWEDGSIGDIYRFTKDCIDDSKEGWSNLDDWKVGQNPLFSHYIGKNKNQFRAKAFAQLRRDIKNGELTNDKFVKLLAKIN